MSSDTQTPAFRDKSPAYVNGDEKIRRLKHLQSKHTKFCGRLCSILKLSKNIIFLNTLQIVAVPVSIDGRDSPYICSTNIVVLKFT